MKTVTAESAVRAAVAAVDDPEFAGVTIADLGMLEAVRVLDGGSVVEVDLLPTFLGCPALGVIADDVRAAAAAIAGVETVAVRFVAEPVWTTNRITPRGRRSLSVEFTVAVPDGEAAITCPVCSGESVDVKSPFGPTACRAIAYCPSCLNPLEVMRG